jgi:protein MpaA
MKKLMPSRLSPKKINRLKGSNLHAGKDPNELQKLYAQAVKKQEIKLKLRRVKTKDKNNTELLATLSLFLVNLITWLRIILKRRNYKVFLGIGLAVLAFVSIYLSFYVFLPQTIAYTYSTTSSCTTSPILFPNLFKTKTQGAFTLTHRPSVSIGHTDLFSYRVCATPITDPGALKSYDGKQEVSIGFISFGKPIMIKTPQYPLVHTKTVISRAIPLEKPLVFSISTPDANFEYQLNSNGQVSTCTKLQSSISCNLLPLKLRYGSTDTATLVRMFHGKSAGIVMSNQLQIVTATAISQSSISMGAEVYDKPQQIIINTNKTIVSLQPVSLTYKSGNTITKIPITTSFIGKTIIINITTPLPRKTALDLRISNVTASDDSELESPYDLNFSTSGGPAVISSNIPSYGMSSGQSMVLTFDQPLATSQDPSSYASLLVNGTVQPATITASGSRLIIMPNADYPICATVKVVISAAAQNAYGISGDSAWSYASRSHCYTTFSIGTSVQGRPIVGYQFGNGPSMVLYIGSMEGNEQNASQLLQQWIPTIDANPGKIPSYRTIVVIPTINPDGYATDTRLNAAGIDLNRNFPANNWQTNVTEPLANTVVTLAGGLNPLSAPESKALASYFQAHAPRLTLTMHSHGAIVEANDAGDSDALGSQYASLARYRAIPTSAIGNFFAYTTTGAFEDWAHDKLGLPVLEVELESPTATEYSRNLPALWAMANVSQ